MKIIFDDYATAEYQDAFEFYELEVKGVGSKFKAEIKRALRIIKHYPEIGSLENDDVRKCILHIFPYKILYSIEKDYVYVIAIAHMHQKPNYWIKRTKVVGPKN